MVIVRPFKGLRPPKEIVKKLASRPYDVMNSEEARKEAEGNEYSLLHVTKAEIDLPSWTDEHSQAVYDKVLKILKLFKIKVGLYKIKHQESIFMVKQCETELNMVLLHVQV